MTIFLLPGHVCITRLQSKSGDGINPNVMNDDCDYENCNGTGFANSFESINSNLRLLNGYFNVNEENFKTREVVYKKNTSSNGDSVNSNSGAGGEFCENIGNDQFAELIMSLCKEAKDLAESRHNELLRWDAKAKARTMEWFGTSEDEVRDFLAPRINKVAGVLRGLKLENFKKLTKENVAETGDCYLATEDADAAVCQTDTKEHRIFLGVSFCTRERDGRELGKNDTFKLKDTQLLTIIHEVTHFNDTFGSHDIYLGVRSAKMTPKTKNHLTSADGLAGYIIGI